ncbi:MAG TPA: mannonate dehydratase [Rhizomicrobium sp.]|jgi:mannonate dehydratase|nr:mannonate dehydratase [Rhizomicrobium sp.]
MDSIDRRGIFAGGAGAAAAGLASAPAKAQDSPHKPVLMKLGDQSGPATDEYFAYLVRYGVTHVTANAHQSDPARLYPTVDELKALKALGAKHGLTLEMTDVRFLAAEGKISDIMLGAPGRDNEIEAVNTTIRNCAEAGIPGLKYNMRLLPILRSAVVPGRGDSEVHRWRFADMKPDGPLTAWENLRPDAEKSAAGQSESALFERQVGHPSEEEVWARISYFLDRVVPVANQYKVRIACHPQDPGLPPGGWHGDPRVLGTVAGLKRFVTIQESAYHGLNFCQGTLAEDLEDPKTQIFDVIRWFGERKKIFNVHFRNIRGRRSDFWAEIFPDEGDIDFAKAIRVYRDIGYDGMIMPDHVPLGSKMVMSENFAFCYGYIRGLLQSADQT